MAAVLDADHVILLLRFLFGRTRATAGQPQPMMRFLDQEPDLIRQDLERNGPLELPGITNNEINPTMPDLMKILDCFLNRQPRVCHQGQGHGGLADKPRTAWEDGED